MKNKLDFLKIDRGFTLVELLIVVAIIAVFAGIGLSSFGSYNNTQVYQLAVSDVATMLSTAKSKAIAQVKPSQCDDTHALSGYQVSITSSSYKLDAVCVGVSPNTNIQTKNFPTGVTGSATMVLFNASTGSVTTPPASPITITGYGGSTKVINVGSTGNITLP